MNNCDLFVPLLFENLIEGSFINLFDGSKFRIYKVYHNSYILEPVKDGVNHSYVKTLKSEANKNVKFEEIAGNFVWMWYSFIDSDKIISIDRHCWTKEYGGFLHSAIFKNVILKYNFRETLSKNELHGEIYEEKQ